MEELEVRGADQKMYFGDTITCLRCCIYTLEAGARAATTVVLGRAGGGHLNVTYPVLNGRDYVTHPVLDARYYMLWADLPAPVPHATLLTLLDGR